MNRKSITLVIFAGFALLMALTYQGVRYLLPPSAPVSMARPQEIRLTGISEPEWRHFLDGDFQIIADVRALPAPVLQTLTEPGGSQLLLANPREKFEAGDVIYNPAVPRERLMFAGVTEGKCFVYYARGGRALSYVVEFFDSTSERNLQQVWKGYCDMPASNIRDLRRCIYERYVFTH